MLAMWAYIEADFRRDYGIRLCEELPRMSWREFQVLLDGLSPHGAVAFHYEAIAQRERLRWEKEEPERTRGESNAFWSRLASFRKPEE